MNTDNCQLCGIKEVCSADGLYLYAPTGILAQRLELVLKENGLAFSIHNQIYALENRTDREALLRTLLAQLSQPEAEGLRVTFDLVSLMNATSLVQAARRAETAWFEEALANDKFVHWFQPIVNAPAHTLAGHECLIRLSKGGAADGFYNGDEIIEAAITRGDLHVFDSYSRRTAIRNAARQHIGGLVFINFTPSSIYDPAFCMASTVRALQDTQLRPQDIVFEVVECERVRDPPPSSQNRRLLPGERLSHSS